jgi:vitamin B12 transporter
MRKARSLLFPNKRYHCFLNGRLLFALTLVFLAPFSLPLRAQDAAYGEYDGRVEDEGDDYAGGDDVDREIMFVGTVETTQQMEVISREQIEKAHAPDIPELMRQTLGLGVTRYGPYGNTADINIRGFDTERLAVLVDGMPVNSTRSGEFDFNTVDIDSIERIEVIYGGSDTKYNVSGALGGVINIVTAKKQDPGWAFSGSVSNTSALPGRYNEQYGGAGNPQWQDLAGAQRLSVSGAYGAQNYSFRANLFGNRAGNHFLYKDDYGYARRKEGNEIGDGGASASFLREFDLSKLILSADIYYGDKHIPASGYTVEYEKQTDFSTRQNIILDMPRAFHDNLSMELGVGHNWGILNYDPGLNPSRHDEHDITFVNRWGWYPAEMITLRLGGDYRFIHLDSTNDGVRDGHRGGLYFSAEYTPVEGFLVVVSVKGVTDGKDLIPVPKLGFAWRINDNFSLKNNYFRSFKFPDFDDLYWTQAGFMGNPDLKSEDGWGADIQAELTAGDLFAFDSSVYWEWTRDSIHWSNASGVWRPENISRGAFLGWDNRAKLTLPFSPGPLERPVLSALWQFQLSWLLGNGLGFGDNRRIPYMPMHTLTASLELPWKTAKDLPGSVTASGRFEGSRYADTGNAIMLDPHFVLDIIFNQKLNETVTVFGTVRNALNAQYVSFADYPMPGVTLTLGARVDIR